jgi:hypothetical protein
MEQKEEVQVRQLPVRLPGPEYDALKTFAFFTQRSMNDVIRAAIQDFLVAHSGNEFDAILGKARTDYRAALDKLAEL